MCYLIECVLVYNINQIVEKRSLLKYEKVHKSVASKTASHRRFMLYKRTHSIREHIL